MNYTLRDGWVVFPDGTRIRAISGGMEPVSWVAVIGAVVAVAATAASTVVTLQGQRAQQQVYKAQAELEDQRAAQAQLYASIEADAIRERAAWEAQATREAAEFEATMAQENADRDLQVARDIANLESASQEQIAAHEAKVAEELAALEAEAARSEGDFQSQQARRRNARILALRRSQAAAAGVELTSGSPLLAELDAIRQGEIEAVGIAHSAEMGALITERRGKLQSDIIKERATTASKLMKGRVEIQGLAGLDEAKDIGTAARYEAALRAVSVESSAAQQSWATLTQGAIRASEARFSAELNRFNARESSTAQSFTIMKGITQAAASGYAAYGSGGGSLFGKPVYPVRIQ